MNVKELNEKRAATALKVKELRDKLEAEKRGMTAEERTDFDKYSNEIALIDEDMVREKRAEDILKAQAEQHEDDKRVVAGKTKEEVRERVNNTFRDLILFRAFGIGKMPDLRILSDPNENPFRELRTNAQSTTDNKGGYTIPEGFSGELAIAEKMWGGMEGVSRIIQTDSGNDIPWPATNDTSNVAYQVDEAADLNTSATDVTFAKALTLKAYKWSSGLVRISQEILEDSYFNMEQILADLFGIRMGRGLNAAYTTGAGTTTISGVVTGATNSSISSVGATAITYNNLVDLLHSVDPAYRMNARFMFNDATLAYLKKIVDGDSKPIWQPTITQNAPDTILGYPYTINQDMASIGASAKSMLFGDFRNYLIRKVRGDRFKILLERYAELDQVAMVLLRRTDGQLLDAGMHPIKYLVHAGS
jgi:HK97 family phage major capsid protein